MFHPKVSRFLSDLKIYENNRNHSHSILGVRPMCTSFKYYVRQILIFKFFTIDNIFLQSKNVPS